MLASLNDLQPSRLFSELHRRSSGDVHTTALVLQASASWTVPYWFRSVPGTVLVPPLLMLHIIPLLGKSICIEVHPCLRVCELRVLLANQGLPEAGQCRFVVRGLTLNEGELALTHVMHNDTVRLLGRG